MDCNKFRPRLQQRLSSTGKTTSKSSNAVRIASPSLLCVCLLRLPLFAPIRRRSSLWRRLLAARVPLKRRSETICPAAAHKECWNHLTCTHNWDLPAPGFVLPEVRRGVVVIELHNISEFNNFLKSRSFEEKPNCDRSARDLDLRPLEQHHRMRPRRPESRSLRGGGS